MYWPDFEPGIKLQALDEERYAFVNWESKSTGVAVIVFWLIIMAVILVGYLDPAGSYDESSYTWIIVIFGLLTSPLLLYGLSVIFGRKTRAILDTKSGELRLCSLLSGRVKESIPTRELILTIDEMDDDFHGGCDLVAVRQLKNKEQRILLWSKGEHAQDEARRAKATLEELACWKPGLD